MEIDKEILKGYIDTILISLLKEKNMYGYEIAKEVREISSDTFELKEGTLYLSLKRLEKNGLLESYWEESDNGGGRRKYYRITGEGIRYFEMKKIEWEFMKKLMDKFIGGAFSE